MKTAPKIHPLHRLIQIGTAVIVLGFGPVTGGKAAPADDLTRAVKATGSSAVKDASPDQFLRALDSILIRKKARQYPGYVTAAVKARPELADKIVGSTFAVLRLNKPPGDGSIPCKLIAEIVQAAISANPAAAEAIVRAAVKAEPSAQPCIVAAALAVAPDEELAIRRGAGEAQTMVFLQAPGTGSINPVNFSGEETVNSPEQPPSTP